LHACCTSPTPLHCATAFLLCLGAPPPPPRNLTLAPLHHLTPAAGPTGATLGLPCVSPLPGSFWGCHYYHTTACTTLLPTFLFTSCHWLTDQPLSAVHLPATARTAPAAIPCTAGRPPLPLQFHVSDSSAYHLHRLRVCAAITVGGSCVTVSRLSLLRAGTRMRYCDAGSYLDGITRTTHTHTSLGSA